MFSIAECVAGRGYHDNICSQKNMANEIEIVFMILYGFVVSKKKRTILNLLEDKTADQLGDTNCIALFIYIV